MHAEVAVCTGCGTQLASALKSCPGCGVLLHRAELETLRQRAEAHRAAGSLSLALADLRKMLELLPKGSKQHQAIEQQVAALSSSVDGEARSAPLEGPAAAPRWLAGLGGVGLLLWKFKWLLVVVLGKAKFLLLGLTKAKTLLTMLLSLGAYWAIWGWRFALGVVLSMYAHEMGHVAALSRFGIRASAPMFVPGLGALVRLEQRLTSPIEEARVGLAGPVYGSAAAVACFALYQAFDAPLFGALAGFGAWLNLFNLLPVWQLDGSRAFAALSSRQRLACASVSLLCALWSGDVILFAIAGLSLLRSFKPSTENTTGDAATMFEFGFLLVLLTALLVATRSVRELH
ncbi:MAG: site-2 protease family protein [Myxococcales bacterium]